LVGKSQKEQGARYTGIIRPRGWRGESQRHAMSSRGILTKREEDQYKRYADALGAYLVSIGAFSVAGESKYFKTDSTGIPIQEDMIANPKYFRENKGITWKIIWLTPKEYEEAIERGFRQEDLLLRGRTDTIPPGMTVREFRIHPSHLQKIIGIMKKTKVSMPFLRYHVGRSPHTDQINAYFDQEGHYRVVAADVLGERQVPVFVEYPVRQKYFDEVELYMTPLIRKKVRGGS